MKNCRQRSNGNLRPRHLSQQARNARAARPLPGFPPPPGYEELVVQSPTFRLRLRRQRQAKAWTLNCFIETYTSNAKNHAEECEKRAERFGGAPESYRSVAL